MMNLSSLRSLVVVIVPSIIGAPAAAEATNPIVKSFGQSFIESLPSLLFATLAIGATLYFSEELKRLLWSVVLRLKSGSAVKFGPIELAALTSIPAAIPEGVGVPSSWRGLKKDNGDLMKLWESYPAYSNNVMLVHKVFPSSEPDQEYDVLLYLVERREGALLGVSWVEYYFGPYWSNYIYPSHDRFRGFPIKVSAYDRFICIARLHFTHTEQTAIVFRYVDFEMGAYPTIPTSPAKPADMKDPDLPRGGTPIEKVVNER
jgi:hypothetical protein